MCGELLILGKSVIRHTLAYRTAKAGLLEGLNDSEIFSRVEMAGSFAGPMRRNLISMLDGIGLQRALGIDSSGALFGNRPDLVHFTSAISAPVFVSEKNYTGHAVATRNSKFAEKSSVLIWTAVVSPACLSSCDRLFLGLYADSEVGQLWN